MKDKLSNSLIFNVETIIKLFSLYWTLHLHYKYKMHESFKGYWMKLNNWINIFTWKLPPDILGLLCTTFGIHLELYFWLCNMLKLDSLDLIIFQMLLDL